MNLLIENNKIKQIFPVKIGETNFIPIFVSSKIDFDVFYCMSFLYESWFFNSASYLLRTNMLKFETDNLIQNIKNNKLLKENIYDYVIQKKDPSENNIMVLFNDKITYDRNFLTPVIDKKNRQLLYYQKTEENEKDFFNKKYSGTRTDIVFDKDKIKVQILLNNNNDTNDNKLFIKNFSKNIETFLAINNSNDHYLFKHVKKYFNDIFDRNFLMNEKYIEYEKIISKLKSIDSITEDKKLSKLFTDIFIENIKNDVNNEKISSSFFKINESDIDNINVKIKLFENIFDDGLYIKVYESNRLKQKIDQKIINIFTNINDFPIWNIIYYSDEFRKMTTADIVENYGKAIFTNSSFSFDVNIIFDLQSIILLKKSDTKILFNDIKYDDIMFFSPYIIDEKGNEIFNPIENNNLDKYTLSNDIIYKIIINKLTSYFVSFLNSIEKTQIYFSAVTTKYLDYINENKDKIYKEITNEYNNQIHELFIDGRVGYKIKKLNNINIGFKNLPVHVSADNNVIEVNHIDFEVVLDKKDDDKFVFVIDKNINMKTIEIDDIVILNKDNKILDVSPQTKKVIVLYYFDKFDILNDLVDFINDHEETKRYYNFIDNNPNNTNKQEIIKLLKHLMFNFKKDFVTSVNFNIKNRKEYFELRDIDISFDKIEIENIFIKNNSKPRTFFHIKDMVINSITFNVYEDISFLYLNQDAQKQKQEEKQQEESEEIRKQKEKEEEDEKKLKKEYIDAFSNFQVSTSNLNKNELFPTVFKIQLTRHELELLGYIKSTKIDNFNRNMNTFKKYEKIEVPIIIKSIALTPRFENEAGKLLFAVLEKYKKGEFTYSLSKILHNIINRFIKRMLRPFLRFFVKLSRYILLKNYNYFDKYTRIISDDVFSVDNPLLKPAVIVSINDIPNDFSFDSKVIKYLFINGWGNIFIDDPYNNNIYAIMRDMDKDFKSYNGYITILPYSSIGLIKKTRKFLSKNELEDVVQNKILTSMILKKKIITIGTLNNIISKIKRS